MTALRVLSRGLWRPIDCQRRSRWISIELAARPSFTSARRWNSSASTQKKAEQSSAAASKASESASNTHSNPPESSRGDSHKGDWDENPDFNITAFSELPEANFGVNQHMLINDQFKEELRSILWQFRAPIRYAFAYGSAVFSQTSSTAPPSGMNGKMIDMIFGVSYTQHWHSLNLTQHREHYSMLGSLGSGVVSRVQDNYGAGVYFNPYVTINGKLIKYGVVNLDNLCNDLSNWDTLYLAGRLQKPVKILRDDPRVRLANQVNLISALRAALLLLPEKFAEYELYSAIAGMSYLGDPRMSLPAENRNKVANIVSNQLTNFRRLYAPLIETLPNVSFKKGTPEWQDTATDIEMVQDMDPAKRGNMVRRLPKKFRERLYFHFQRKYQIPQLEFNDMLAEAQDEDATGKLRTRVAGPFEKKIAKEPVDTLRSDVQTVISKTIKWPSTVQTVKGLVTAGVFRSSRYVGEKMDKWKNQSNDVGEKPEVKGVASDEKSLSSSPSSEPKSK